MPIKNLTDLYRPVRQGKIHLGIMKESKDGKPYPSEVDFFVIPTELQEFYGATPKELNVSLPSARLDRSFDLYLEKTFPQYLKRYKGGKGYGVLVCKGDGEVANTWDEEEGGMKEIPCPCDYFDKGDCRKIGILRVRIREVASFNIYQITTSSFNSIVNINSFIRDLIEHCAVYRIDPSSVKLVLRRKEQPVQRITNGTPKKSTHYILELDLDPKYYKTLDDVKGEARLMPAKTPEALPPVDESKDELFYPEGGFKPEEEESQEEADNLDDLKDELSDTLRMYRDCGGQLSQKEEDRLDSLVDSSGYQAAITYFKKKIEKLQPELFEGQDGK